MLLYFVVSVFLLCLKRIKEYLLEIVITTKSKLQIISIIIIVILINQCIYRGKKHYINLNLFSFMITNNDNQIILHAL